VDITTTGGTLAANALKIVEDGIILRSEANLVASVGAAWGPASRRAAATILSRISAEEEARTTREVRVTLASGAQLQGQEIEERFSARPLGPITDGGAVFQCPQVTILPFAEWLVSAGALRVAVTRSDYVFSASNALVERLERRIG
jgi:ATP phosphoribosyltransferase